MDDKIIFRCCVCGRRLGDYKPPVGEAVVICARCKTKNTLSIRSPEQTARDDILWVVRRGIRQIGR